MDWIWGALTDMPIPELMQGTLLKPSGPTSHPAAPRTTPVWIPPPQAGTSEHHCRGVSPLTSPGSMVAPVLCLGTEHSTGPTIPVEERRRCLHQGDQN